MTKKKPDFLRDLDTAIMDELTGGGIKGNAAGLVGTLTQIKEIKQLCGLPFCGYMAKLETVRPSGVPDEVMVASGELAAADLLAKIESAENQRYIECGVAAVEEEKKAVTVYYCDEAAVGMKFVAGDVSGTVQGVTHIQTDEAAAAGEAGNDRTALTLSKAVKAGCKVIALERTDTVAGMTTDDIAALKGVLKQYE